MRISDWSSDVCSSDLLTSLDPRALLSRGYAMVRDGGGAIVTTAGKARDAGHLRLQFADGDVPVQVSESDAPPPAATNPPRKSPPTAPNRGQGEHSCSRAQDRGRPGAAMLY